MRRIGVAARLLVLALFALFAIPLQLLALRFGWPIRHRLPMWFHRLFLRLFGVRITERGRPPGGVPTLVLSNHVSWLDIPVIGSLHPLSFIAKSEVETWPIVGLLAKLQRSVFIDRQRRRATAEVNDALAHRLAKGEVMVLFAEGTTGDGNRLLPFRSSLVGAAQAALVNDADARVVLQPLAIAYTRRSGMPVTRRDRPYLAWYGDMELAPHLGAFVRGGAVDVEVTWGEPISFNGNRKEATATAEAAVREAVNAPLFSCSVKPRKQASHPGTQQARLS
ncbi:lysophospholipid acyltransferase family protein [Microvirga brassicacearum]|uniref:1-acyl-sn-glycerol-3-phosphate acyltransferase n=1 Tax=Microvirga brassicacearum TaxID=2580413 RepID=A0A5N3PDY0_9HYPH|nr:lysophospholipid acyltransferase family protein [Microvirga brassicacearum]KAB0267936.1 1-acyl-sn-glycerol-3-phosphate acyltransferase [Microvirga brassicacearum]